MLVDVEGEGPSATFTFVGSKRDTIPDLPPLETAAIGESDLTDVEIPDTPGSLARLFADVEAAGVNVEDVTIDHDTQAERGWLAVHVDASAAEPLAAAMTAAGWNVRPTA